MMSCVNTESKEQEGEWIKMGTARQNMNEWAIMGDLQMNRDLNPHYVSSWSCLFNPSADPGEQKKNWASLREMKENP